LDVDVAPVYFPPGHVEQTVEFIGEEVPGSQSSQL
jgi:hypothetical protein